MCLYQQFRRSRSPRRYGNDHGIALISALMFLVVLALLGTTAAMVTTLYSQISGNYKTSVQAFQAAEAGAEEARARLRGGAANAANKIDDNFSTQTDWKAYIGSLTQAQAYGYTSGAHQVRADSLQNALQYTAVITHATNSGGQILYWGDATGTGVYGRNTTTGKNIYLVTSYGTTASAHSTVQTQVAPLQSPPLRGTLYVKASTTISGNANINGLDQCAPSPAQAVNLPGIVTTLDQTTIDRNGSSYSIQGSPTGIVDHDTPPLDIQGIMDSFNPVVDKSYTAHNVTQTANTTPGPADNWGTPTPGLDDQHHPDQSKPSSCTDYNIIHYNTDSGTGRGYIKLSGGVQGCGLLLVEGDLEISGDFSWYGAIVVTGAISYTGGGNKNVTGAMLAGGAVQADVIGGNTNIVNCSNALRTRSQTGPLRVLSWGTL